MLRRLIFSVVCAGVPWMGLASNYPLSSSYQSVKLVQNSPAFFAHVKSEYLSKHLIGYVKSGYLAKNGAESLDAIVFSSCEHRGSRWSKTTTIKLGKEWHGHGYLSFPITIENHMPKECFGSGFWSVGIAFSDGQGNWDSQFGSNYPYNSKMLYGVDAHPKSFDMNTPGSCTDIEESIWDFILKELH